MKNILSTAALTLALLLGAELAWADLMLFPTRVVFEKNQRAAQVELMNRGDKPETYRISLVNRRMTETGEIVEARDALPGEQFANDLVRYSPRQVTLQPGLAQTVRLSVRKPAGLAAGEYRSHLQFDRVPDAEGQANLENLAKPEEGQIAIALQALIGASIPVIVRNGDTSADVTLDELKIETAADKSPLLDFTIHRSGNRSVYGDIVAEFTPSGGQAQQVARVAGVAVYVPNDRRLAKLPLTVPGGTLKNGVLTLRYTTPTDSGSKLLAEAELKLR